MTCCWGKSSNLSKIFWLTALMSQSIEGFYLGSKTKIQIFQAFVTVATLLISRIYLYICSFFPWRININMPCLYGWLDWPEFFNFKDWIPCLSAFSYHGIEKVYENSRSKEGGFIVIKFSITMVALCGVTSKSLKFVKSVDFELKQVLMFTTTAISLEKEALG